MLRLRDVAVALTLEALEGDQRPLTPTRQRISVITYPGSFFCLKVLGNGKGLAEKSENPRLFSKGKVSTYVLVKTNT